MATFTLPIAEEDVPRVVGALCVNSGYIDITYANALSCVMKYISDVVANVEAIEAKRTALAELPDFVPIVFADIPSATSLVVDPLV